jgi:CheY-like chemotaxis protein
MNFKDCTILIIDDEEVYIKFLKKMIEKEFGAQVDIANNPKEAFEYFKRKIPDLVLLDMQMPMMDGLTALKLIRSAPATKDIPVIPCTAMSNKGLVIQLAEQNITDYIVKSGNVDIYRKKIVDALMSLAEKKINKNRVREND